MGTDATLLPNHHDDEGETNVRHTLFVNPKSGSGTGDDRLDAALAALPDAEVVRIEPGVDLGSAVDAAIAADRVVVAAGGDGTVNAVAQHVVGRGVLGVLPWGTLNHFARDLGVDDPDVALETLRTGETATIDAGRVDGCVFVNNVGLGLYPELVRTREQHEHRVGKVMATIRAALTVIFRAEPVCGTVVIDGEKHPLRAWIVFVGNNCFGTERGALTRREQLDGGVLDVRILSAGKGALARVRGAVRATSGRAWSSKRLLAAKATDVRLVLDAHPMPVARDGEACDPVDHVDIEIVAGALQVLVPRPSPEG
jgi:undecaprenyl-diphosphatase